jgi:cytochrome oxidase Cu insertion factor (SCO1/SenC/PrrC family)
MRLVERQRRLMVAAALWLGVVIAAQSAAGQDQVRRLLEALGMDIPARQMLAPSVTLLGLDGTQVRLADLQGRVVMLYFWTTW